MARSKTIENIQSPDSFLAERLSGQLLTAHTLQSPASVVEKMGAMQAQHFEMAKWAVGSRLTGWPGEKVVSGRKNKPAAPTVSAIHTAIEKGEIVRTHALRPTWHLVAGEDLLWILELTAPAIKRALFSRDKKLGISEKEYLRSDEAIRRILQDHQALNREQLVAALRELGFVMDLYRTNHYIMHAELSGIICSGPVREDKHTYALSENILGKRYAKALALHKQFKGPAAAYELARRYFTSRGPATLQDFAWWSGLGMTVIKKAIAQLGNSIRTWQANDTSFYQIPDSKTAVPGLVKEAAFRLLPAFDEYLISYKDRRLMLDSNYNSEVITVNGLFRPVMIAHGKVIGGWQVEKGKKGISIRLLPFEPLKTTEKKKVLGLAEPAASAYCDFRQMPLESVVFA